MIKRTSFMYAVNQREKLITVTENPVVTERFVCACNYLPHLII